MPSEHRHIHYAFHLSSKEIALGNKAPLRFVEFRGVTGKLTHAINNKLVLTEGIDQKSVGVYQHLRLRIERKDRGRILTTRTAVIIQGKQSSRSGRMLRVLRELKILN